MKSYVVTILAVVLLACLFQETDSEPRLWVRWRRRRYCKKVDCAFGSWNRWGSCSRTCGPYGVQSRERSYLRQASCGGKHCYGSLKETRSCNHVCLHEGILKYRRCYCKPGYSGQCCQSVTGAWSSWGRWGTCSKTCGYGLQTSRRQCNNPSTKYGKKACPGSDTKTRSCHKKSCAADGGWSSWGKWESCSKSCGTGTRRRSRSCTHPRPGYGGKRCYGPSEQTQNCNTKRCPVNGGWSSWGKWCACSKKCGGGTQYRTRSCTNPPPDYGGKDCPGKSKQTKKCNNQPCPVNGGWSSWGKWGRCSKTCGDGTQKRRRYCTNPRPKYGGKSCPGSGIDVQTCHSRPCKVNGCWSSWGDWSECSKTCGSGSKIRRRSCTNPPPQHGGTQCRGKDEQTKLCKLKNCVVNGGWSSWGKWCACSKKCGGGTQYRTRSCTNPRPGYGGKACTGTNKESRDCNTQSCPVNGRWSLWGDWSECTKTCGSGSKIRRRSCTNPPPQHGGKTCKGTDEQIKLCVLKNCPVDGGWSSWSRWCACSKSCGTGTQYRTRSCTNPRPDHGGKDCPGTNKDTRQCNAEPCPVNGRWSLWGDWSECTKTCGSGSKIRRRSCTSPPPQHGGKTCKGIDEQTKLCNVIDCPDQDCWKDWSDWSPCDKMCDCGLTHRVRYCRCGYGHRHPKCQGPGEESKDCNCDPCPNGPPNFDAVKDD